MSIKNKELKNKKFVAIVTVILCSIFGILYIAYSNSNIIMNDGFVNDTYRNLYFIISFSLLAILISIILCIILKNKIELNKLFMILAIIFGIYYLIVAPIRNGSDELQHFYRVFEIATGQIIPKEKEDGNIIDENVPLSFMEVINTKKDEKTIKIHQLPEKMLINLNKSETGERIGTAGTRGYSPIVYIPQTIGMVIGLAANLKPVIIANMSRIFGFIVWILISAYAIKIAPSKKEFFVILALLPSNITSAVTLSADTILNAFALLLTAKVFQLSVKEGQITIKDYVVLLISNIIIGQCKMAYLPLIFIALLLIPKEKYGSKNKYIIANVIIICLSLLGTYIWIKMAAAEHYGTEINEQEKWILLNPVNYIIVMFTTVIEKFSELFYGIAAGTNLYQARVQVPSAISFGLMSCLIISLFIKDSQLNIKVWKKIIVALLMLAMFVLIFTAMYVSATTIVTNEIGTRTIEECQGRYFIPIIMLSIFLFNKKVININERYIYIVSIMLQFTVVVHTLQTFI